MKKVQLIQQKEQVDEKQKHNEKHLQLLLLHGTGRNEQDLIPLAYELDKSAAILSPRGKVLENGITPRFFRRLAEGVFDLEDLKFRTNELADFVIDSSKTYGFNLQHVIAIGYSKTIYSKIIQELSKSSSPI
jgi:predicted esterase